MAEQTVLPYVDALTPQFLESTIKERDPNGELAKTYLHKRLFPMKSIPEDRFAWEVSPAGLNWLAGFFSQDGRPVPAGEIDSKVLKAEVTRIMANYILDETIVKNLRNVGVMVKQAGEEILAHPTASSPLQRHQKAIMDHTIMIDNQIEAQLEYLATSAIQGKISWPPRDTQGNYVLPLNQLQPYWGQTRIELTVPIPALHKQNASTLATAASKPGTQVPWTNTANSNIIKDLDIIREIIGDTTGNEPDYLTLVLSKDMWTALASNENLIKAMRGNGTLGISPSMITTQQIKMLMKDYLRINIIEYNLKWTYKVSKGYAPAELRRAPFINPNKVIIFPSNDLGVGFMGTSPAKGPRSEWKAGKFAWVYESDRPPFMTEIGVGINAFPVAQRWDEFFVLDGAN